jgi:acetyl-CoA acyltransferase
VESMSRIPMFSAVGSGLGQPFGDTVYDRYGVTEFNQGTGAELIAERWGQTREQLDEYSVGSHRKAAAATSAGAFGRQLAVLPGTLEADEGIRPDSSVEALGKLKTVFKPDGVIHAGNASQISDGSGALLIMTSEKATELGLTPMARLHTMVLAGSDPVIMLTAPIPATAKALARSGLRLAETGADPALVNPLGGAIATGHPLGGSGAVLMTRLVHHMAENSIGYGLQTMCQGGGMANATILELL